MVCLFIKEDVYLNRFKTCLFRTAYLTMELTWRQPGSWSRSCRWSRHKLTSSRVVQTGQIQCGDLSTDMRKVLQSLSARLRAECLIEESLTWSRFLLFFFSNSSFVKYFITCFSHFVSKYFDQMTFFFDIWMQRDSLRGWNMQS